MTRSRRLPFRFCVFIDRSSDDFVLGEVWEDKGLIYDLLSAAACS